MNQQSELSADHTAIIDVIYAETDAFMRLDYEDWAKCWVQDHRVRFAGFSPDFGLMLIEGWEELSAYMRDALENGNDCGMIDFERDNIQISISGDTAWVVFDGGAVQPDGRVERTFETRVLERKQGAWRISYLAFASRRARKTDTNRLVIDGSGQVVWMADGARDALTAHPGLCVSHGQLRARKPSWDKPLQEAIKRAAELHGYFEQHQFVQKNGSVFRCPVVLGEDERGGVVVCTLFVRDGATYVELQQDGDLKARLEVARAIFGLSPGQLGLAERIVQGDGLTSAAEALGITVNTARTHLKRIYDKTGVNSQTALVRTLLSVG